MLEKKLIYHLFSAVYFNNGAYVCVKYVCTCSTTYARLIYVPTVSGEDKGAYGDTGITFQAKKCFYPGCVTPKGEESSAPPTDRPDHATMWSDVSTWTAGSVWGSVLGGAGTSSKLPPPSTSTKLTIAAGTYNTRFHKYN